MDLARLNHLPADEARQVFLDCCASAEWADHMTRTRPFGGEDDLLEAARAVWRSLGQQDREEAFAAHPRIGDQVTGSDRHSSWSRREQAAAGDASPTVQDRLAACNRAYQDSFDRVFLVVATGRSAEEILALCEERLGNDAETEYRMASAEQEKITDLRLRRLLGIG